MKRSLFLALSLVVSFSAAANAGPSLNELLDGAEKVNELKGPFGAKHRWDQYVDAQTTSLEFRFQGNVYGWRDIHSRVSFFRHGALRSAAKGKDLSDVDTGDYTSTVTLVDDAGIFYLAGWRNFADDELSVFSIAPVDTELLGKIAAEAVQVSTSSGGQKSKKKVAFDKSHIASLAQDRGLSILLQGNSQKQKAGKLGVDVQPRLGRDIDVNALATTFANTENHVDWAKNYVFPAGPEGGNFTVSAAGEMSYALGGCDIEELGPEFFESGFMLSSLGTCFYLKSGSAERLPDLPTPYTLWRWLGDRVAANPISVGPHPSELSEDSARKTRYTAVSGHADASAWTSWSDDPTGKCKAGRDVSKGDWIVVNFEPDKVEGYNYFQQFDEGSLNRFPDQFHYLLNGGSIPWFMGDDCEFPKSVSVSLYYSGEIMSQSILTDDFVRNHYESGGVLSLSHVLRQRVHLNKFLTEEVGVDLWRYAENLR